ncbi:MAG: hypothetical protein R2818_03690 [Flavobacteriales bacterium]
MKYGYAAIALFAISLVQPLVKAQGDNTSFNWKFEEGNKLMEEKFYNQAAEIWDGLLATDPENANLNYKLGYSYFHSYNQKSKALPYLEKASALRTANFGSFNTSGYDPFDSRERNAPPEVDYYLWKAYHVNKPLTRPMRPIRSSSTYRSEARPQRSRSYGQAYRQCTCALQAEPMDYRISNVGAGRSIPMTGFQPGAERGRQRLVLHQPPCTPG